MFQNIFLKKSQLSIGEKSSSTFPYPNEFFESTFFLHFFRRSWLLCECNELISIFLHKKNEYYFFLKSIVYKTIILLSLFYWKLNLPLQFLYKHLIIYLTLNETKLKGYPAFLTNTRETWTNCHAIFVPKCLRLVGLTMFSGIWERIWRNILPNFPQVFVRNAG